MSPTSRFLLWLLLALALLPAACYSEGSGLPGGAAGGGAGRRGLVVPDAGPQGSAGASGAGDADVLPDARTVFACPIAETLEPVPARTQVMTGKPEESPTMFVSDLVRIFASSCAGCHMDGSLGSFHVSPSTFSADLDRDDVLERILSDDPTKVMPTGAGKASSRDAKTDAALQLAELLRAWYDQGRPSNVFVRPTGGPAGSAAEAGAPHSFLLTEEVGSALTNLGSCIPSPEAIAVLPEGDIDSRFSAMTELPARLEDTDVTTYDSAILAEHGVVAFAPGYPLWADGARKIRYVRVPRGKSIRFDKATQAFDIPDNTRFYKTFLRKVVEKDGSERYRKMETRLIVARKQNPLFGTYQWDPYENEATLDNEPLRDQKPGGFKDRVLTYVTDEAKYEELTALYAGDQTKDHTAELAKAGAIHHYAIPGSDRCIQCHMGSPGRDFVLGFLPLQINRRPKGEGGTLEDTGPDELNQLRRLIDYGVVTGVDDPADILPLEESQGKRAPRNDHELVAQGYMLGNCAHCHNPNGFPSVQNAVLVKALNFLPGTAEGEGIFQFPLEKFSPRIKRDLGGSVEIPYITPSLVDYPGLGDLNHTAAHDDPIPDPDIAKSLVLAPWRSLIYRNVDSPFPYSDDLALFPHMPMNTPGYDCRISQIMGDWMVSIPAVRKRPETDERLIQGVAAWSDTRKLPDLIGFHNNTDTDTEAQPYVEVLPPDPESPTFEAEKKAYDAAAAAAAARLDLYRHGGQATTAQKGSKDLVAVDPNPPPPSDCFHCPPPPPPPPETKTWSRYGYCPDSSDIIDPTVTGADKKHLVPNDLVVYQDGEEIFNVPADFQATETGLYSEDLKHVPSTAEIVWPSEGVPDRPHWVITDTTENPPPWAPRRDDWADILVDHEFSEEDGPLARAVVEMLNPLSSGEGVRLTASFRDYALTEFPYGLWKAKPECQKKLAGKKKAGEYQGADRPKWIVVAGADAGDPVYTLLPGAAVFNMVCVNCHGPKADSHGRQADTLQTMTGGSARVANFRDGLFGPTDSPGANRGRPAAEGGFDATPGVAGAPSVDDWAARYLTWMALGGTQKLIPRSILNVVATTPIFGVSRKLPGVDSANMLGPIQTLCGQFFQISSWGGGLEARPYTTGYSEFGKGPWLWSKIIKRSGGTLMDHNGDAEFFARLCTLNNPMPVAVIQLAKSTDPTDGLVSYRAASSYPPGARVGNDRGDADVGLLPGNTMPWCVKRPEDPPLDLPFEEFHALIDGITTTDGEPLPLCPTEVARAPQTTYQEVRSWSYRGAINGGLAVFVYLDEMSKGYTPIPPYDECESLP